MIGVGVIGCGYWGPNLVRNFYKLSNSKMVAVSDLNPARLDYMRDLYPALKTTTNAMELIHCSDIEAVIIVTPPATHYELAIEALREGKHVLLTKPMTQSSAQAWALIELAEKQQRVLMVDHTFVYTGAVRKIRELIDGDELGQIYYFDSVRVNLGLLQSNANVLWDLGPHDFSIVDYVFDAEPISVSAIGIDPLQYSHKGLESVAYVTVRLHGDVMAHFHLSWLSPAKIRRTMISGSRQMVIYDHLDPDHQVKIYNKGVELLSAEERYQVLVQYRVGNMFAPKVDQTEALEIECQHFIDCCLGEAKPLTDGYAGLRVVRLLEAAQQSMERGGEVVSLES